jgi:hypothetical protein
VILHGTPEAVVDQIRALETDAGMSYLMAALARIAWSILRNEKTFDAPRHEVIAI